MCIRDRRISAFAENTRKNSHRVEPDLDGGKKMPRLPLQLKNAGGPPIAVFMHLLEFELASGGQGNF